ncbi:bifunctional adenosylcobinamide kinase/adenosylcobinamide-phosphate guanylyltransferase [Microvirga subterranea]|uniref:Bifunctional adenosylcobalamin biosynthesis protein n=1 Tax=Microvirga subterranea TaxID=186651 RepID=A0A370HHH4_9HYPH|nr:bifunctional adenosylcobinamide kinase/adenosylcobinamide-phosphate guanylyltransferase [Microvirga subterranea]RDI57358.1 adenosylcobinamide kinase /adenosylcobinamide-phosphate guanylyltransferase [Microvirga subterranea]
MITSRRILVLGGARSGKSRTAQALAEGSFGQWIYVATAQALDDEMRERIGHHKAERSGHWQTCEAPIALPEAVRRETGPGRIVLVDCLTLWLSNILLDGRDPADATTELVLAIREAAGPLVIVSNEVGHGIVPATPLGRAFRDAQGRLNQSVAEVCEAVVFVAAGCPILLKPAPPLGLTLG